MRKYIIALAVIMIIALAACTTTTQTTGTTANAPPTENIVANAPAQTQNTEAPQTVNAFNELKTFVTGVPQYWVSYDMATGATVSTFKEYFKSTKMRTDTSIQGIQSRTYIIDGVITSCTSMSGSWNCMVLQQQKSQATDDLKNNIDSYQQKITRIADRMVAGVTTQCYQVVTNVSTSVFCYSADGIPLYMEGTSSGITWSMTATAFGKDVTDNDFTIPATTSSTTDITKNLPPGVTIPTY